jgi:uncharacterized protein (TIGR02246 family)
MNQQTVDRLQERILAAWNSQDVGRVLDCYTADAEFLDPDTGGPLNGKDAFAQHLEKLFGNIVAVTTARSAFPAVGVEGVTVLWTATVRRATGNAEVQLDGVDFVRFDGELVDRHEVYFDRVALMPLLEAA